MKFVPDPSPEFAGLAKSRYQRYVLWQLESAARSAPWKWLVPWVIAVYYPLFHNTGGPGMGPQEWFVVFVTTLMGLAMARIYFSRAVLEMLRGCRGHHSTQAR